ncbi:MAG: PAS domain-containing sensor histidine kinase [Alphaproteobacteria bacterium]|nr:PAS domain-containing sensor histidine kinase [Alphaproteobacteria bacterium]
MVSSQISPSKTSRRSKPPASALQVQHDLLKSILDHVADPIFVKDSEHRLIYGNKALSEILGRIPEEYIGKNDKELFPSEQVEVFWEKDNHVFETGEVDVNEERLTDSHGKMHVISTKKTRCTMGGHKPVIVGISRDVTALKEVERLKNEFIAMISHELHTPLTSIHASLALLSSGTVCELPKETEVMMNIAYKNSERLVRLVDEILDIEKIEAGMLHPRTEVLCIAKFLAQAIEENSAYGQKYNVLFKLGEVPVQCLVVADANRLMQVMANLLSNAAKFSKRGGKVVVLASVTRKSRVRIEVRDSGAGISDKFRSRIFQKFSQGDTSATRQHSGTGLGLSITKKLVEAMSGEISFTSKLGKGTSFFVELPMAKEAKVTVRRYGTR